MIFYRGFVVEWIDYRKDFRVYDPKYPYQTCAYEDSFSSAKKHIDEEYDRLEDRNR